jgi:hypothetical protein
MNWPCAISYISILVVSLNLLSTQSPIFDLPLHIPGLLLSNSWYIFFLIPPQVHTNFRVPPPGYGGSVTDFWGWDAHEAQLRCPDGVRGDI